MGNEVLVVVRPRSQHHDSYAAAPAEQSRIASESN